MTLTANLPSTAKPIAFNQLMGWHDDDHRQTMATFRRSCEVLVRRKVSNRSSAKTKAYRRVCEAVVALPRGISNSEAKSFFQRHFQPYAVIDRKTEIGLFTGYFEPEIAASRTRDANHTYPLRAAPKGLVTTKGKRLPKSLDKNLTHALRHNGSLLALPDRAAIEAGALDRLSPPIAWLRSHIDGFFLHIQGSGRLQYADGSTQRVSYAGKNGYPYTSIGKILIDRGQMQREDVSMQTLRNWMEADASAAEELMAQNRSYIFFQINQKNDPNLGPIGQQGIPLTTGRSLAVDLKYHPAGTLLWLETLVPAQSGGQEIFSRLMVAQDTGSAIKGRIRGDIFFGSGSLAGSLAGDMKAEGRLVVLVPKS